MRNLILCLALILTPALGYGQFDVQRFKKDAPAFEKAINETVTAILPDYGLLQKARSTYLEGYGAVFVVEVALERGANPFFNPVPTDVKLNVDRRGKELKAKLRDLLKKKFSEFKSVKDSESIAVIVYLMNYNPVIVPDLPSQIVLTAKSLSGTVEVTDHEYHFEEMPK